MNYLHHIGRSSSLFADDIIHFKDELDELVQNSSFLVIGGAGSIGSAVCKEIFQRRPAKLHVVDLSENNLVELVRDLRSSLGYISGEFRTYTMDAGSADIAALFSSNKGYDYVFNLSALKHVRSEKDPYSLMRMTQVNVINSSKIHKLCEGFGVKNYFCVSTDKAASPINFMGASKRIMEIILSNSECKAPVSLARFANVAYSDGSLLKGFVNRFEKLQPISGPSDVLRYFMTEKEAGQLCLLSGLLGGKNEIFIPRLEAGLKLTSFKDIAEKFLNDRGFRPSFCESEDEARNKIDVLRAEKRWPCYFSKSETSGEKSYEIFHTDRELVDNGRFKTIGVVTIKAELERHTISKFESEIESLIVKGNWTKEDILLIYKLVLPDFRHTELHKNLDEKM